MLLEQKKYNAFSLIELMVVIAFISIMTAVVLASYASDRDQKAVQTEARKVAASIREAQNDALTGARIGSGNSIPCQFRWKTMSSTEYWIRLQSTCGLGGNEDVKYVLQNGAPFKNVDATNPPTANYITFDFLVPFGNLTPGYFGAATSLILEKGSSYYTICVNGAGNVTELSGSVACP